MYWVNGSNTVTVNGVPTFQAANPGAGIPNGTEITAEWLADVQGELLNLLSTAGVVPAQNTPTQVLQALRALFAPIAGMVIITGTGGNLTPAQSSAFVLAAFTGNGSINLPAPAYGLKYRIRSNGSYPCLVNFGTNFVAFPDGSQLTSSTSNTYNIPATIGSGIDVCCDGQRWYATPVGQTIVSNATTNNEAVALGQFGQYGGNSVSSASATTASTSVSFTAPCKCIIVAIGNGGTGSANVTQFSFSASGAEILFSSQNWSNTSTLGSGTALALAAAGAAVTLTQTIGASSSSVMTVGFNYFIIPVA